jgi:hypothetical protein
MINDLAQISERNGGEINDASRCFNPFTHCPRCSYAGTCVHHGNNTICDRDPEYAVNVIVEYFKKWQRTYLGIVWEAIVYSVLQALGWEHGKSVTIDGMGRIYRD